MWQFKINLPELDQFPAERRKAILESFNSSTETAVFRERLDKLPFRLAAAIAVVVEVVMILVYKIGFGPCMLAGLLCFVVGVPIGVLIQIKLWKRAFKRYVQKSPLGVG